MKTLIRNGRAALADRVQDADVLVEDGRIAAVGRLGPVDADRIIDAAGCYVLPGLMDFHTHVDDQIGRFYLADSYESGTRVALQNGITTLCTFVTQGPGQSLAPGHGRGPGQGRGPQPLRRALAPHPHHLRAGRPAGPGDAAGGRLPDPEALHHLQGRRDLRQLRAASRTCSGAWGPWAPTSWSTARTTPSSPRWTPPGWTWARPAATPCCAPKQAEVVAIQRVVELALDAPGRPARGARLHRRRRRILVRSRPWATSPSRPARSTLCLDDTWLAREDGHRWLCSPPLRGGRPQLLADGPGRRRRHHRHRPLRLPPPGQGRLGRHRPARGAQRPARHRRPAPRDLEDLGGRPGPGGPGPGHPPGPEPGPPGRGPGPQRRPVPRPGRGHRGAGPLRPRTPLHSTLVPAFEAFPGFTSRLLLPPRPAAGRTPGRGRPLLDPDQPHGLPLQPSPATLSFH